MVHFPMMRAYASASGLETGRAQRDGREFDLNAALLSWLELVNPKITGTRRALIDAAYESVKKFSDEKRLKDFLVEDRGVTVDKATLVIAGIRDLMKPENKGLIVRMVIASVIEQQFSAKDRTEYLIEVFTGGAD